MKIRPLPITDLANFSVLPRDRRREALERFRSGRGTLTYEPTRRKLADIVNRQPGVFPSVRTPLPIIITGIEKASRSDEERYMNVAATTAIYQYCVAHEVNARELDGYPLNFSFGVKLVCWAPALFVYRDRLSVPFFDMRRAHCLSPTGRKFMFSAMHWALRVNNPDYSSVEFEILRLANTSTRDVYSSREQGQELFSYEELEERVFETHNLWVQIEQGRQYDRWSAGGGSPGALL